MLFDPDERRELFAAMSRGEPFDADAVLEVVTARHPPRELRLGVLLDRVVDLCERARSPAGATAIAPSSP